MSKLKPIRPGDKRFIHLTLKGHKANEIYYPKGYPKRNPTEARQSPLKGTKTFVFEVGNGHYTDLTLENIDTFLPNRGTLHDKTQREFLERCIRKGIKVRVGERIRDKKTAERWQALYQSRKQQNEAYESYPKFKRSLQRYCEWEKIRHKLIKREIHRALKDGSVEIVYGYGHTTLDLDLKKAGLTTNVKKEPRTVNWYSKIVRKAERRLPVHESDYKRAYLERFIQLPWFRGASNKSQMAKQEIINIMLERVNEKVLDEMIAHRDEATLILLWNVGIREKTGIGIEHILTYANKFPKWVKNFSEYVRN